MTIRSAIFNLLIWASLLTLPLQYLIDHSAENMAACCVVLTSGLLVLFYLRETTALEFHPLSSVALLGFCLSSQLGALLVQTIAWTALRSSLYDALYTFGTLAFYQAIAVAMHALYRFFSVRKPTDVRVVRGILKWAGIYRTPSCGSLWFMGCIGLPTFAFWNYEGVIAKIVAGFTFLTWAPFLIPFYSSEVGARYCNLKLNIALLVCYSGAVGLLGIALNARGVMFAGVATVGLLYFLVALRSKSLLTGRALGRAALLAVILAALSVPVSDLATAMVIARGMRGKVSAKVMVKSTLRILRQPGLIKAYRLEQAAASRYSPYDEHYIANPMLGRLVETKFYDNAFHFARTIKSDEARARLREVSIQLAWAGLPKPALNLLNIKIDKDELDYSMGDYLAYLSRGVPLAGRKTGNMFAQGIALFGPIFPFLYAVICLAIYAVMDLLTIRPVSGAARISAIGMLNIWNFFMGGITYESLHKALNFFLRYFWQILLIYVGVFSFARLFENRQKTVAVLPAPVPPVTYLQRSF